MDVVKKVEHLRRKFNWSFYKLSQESGVSPQTLYHWECGRSLPSVPALMLVCEAFGISMAQFFAEEGLVEVTPATTEVFENWKYLTYDEQNSVKNIIGLYVKNKR